MGLMEKTVAIVRKKFIEMQLHFVRFLSWQAATPLRPIAYTDNHQFQPKASYMQIRQDQNTSATKVHMRIMTN